MSADFHCSMDELDFTETLHARQVRRVYLIKVLEFFTKQKDDKNPPLQWSCCQEPHADDGKHHTVIRFEKLGRWMPIKKYMIQNFGKNLHFSSQNLGYVAAYQYICKDKSPGDVLLSPGHVNFHAIGSARTKRCMKSFAANAKVRRESLEHSETPCSSKSKIPQSKVKRLSNVEVFEFILGKNITDESQLLAIAKEHHELSEKDLHRFVVNKTLKTISDSVKRTQHIHSAPEIIRREKTARLHSVKALLFSGECVA